MIRIDDQNVVNKLLNEPESGMGYQFVTVERLDGSTENGIAYNATLILLEDQDPRIAKFRPSYFASLVRAAAPSSNIRDVRVREPSASLGRAVYERRSADTSATHEAKNAPVGTTNEGDVFKRFSAFEKDLRVMADRSLRPGSYATTNADAQHVKTGSDAVKRYALPNPSPASWVFTIRPPQGTKIQEGIVAPSNHQPGGGVEVIFSHGTQAQTTTGPVHIPD